MVRQTKPASCLAALFGSARYVRSSHPGQRHAGHGHSVQISSFFLLSSLFSHSTASNDINGCLSSELVTYEQTQLLQECRVVTNVREGVKTSGKESVMTSSGHLGGGGMRQYCLCAQNYWQLAAISYYVAAYGVWATFCLVHSAIADIRSSQFPLSLPHDNHLSARLRLLFLWCALPALGWSLKHFKHATRDQRSSWAVRLPNEPRKKQLCG